MQQFSDAKALLSVFREIFKAENSGRFLQRSFEK